MILGQLAEQAQSIWNAGVDSVRPRDLVRQLIQLRSGWLHVAERRFELSGIDRVIVVGAGKATADMAAGLEDALAGAVPLSGWINVPEGVAVDAERIHVHPARPPGLNEPTVAAMRGAEQIHRFVAGATPRDLCIALISGGGSALLPMPVDGITLDDKLAVTRRLSASGANIEQLNTVRKHLSKLKGGGLLSACKNTSLVTLVLSDVLGDPLDLIASGPTVPDPSTKADALKVLDRFDPDKSLPGSIYAWLESDAERKTTPNTQARKDSSTIVIGNNERACIAASNAAEAYGWKPRWSSATHCEGLAEDVGRDLADQIVSALQSEQQSVCLVSGGEPTVELADESIRGKGGRNQQLVLAAYQHLCKIGLDQSQWQRIAFLSGGTDGEDGPTDAAGAWLDAEIHHAIQSSGLSASEALRRNDAYTFFHRMKALLMSGATGTNVCDLRVALVRAIQ